MKKLLLAACFVIGATAMSFAQGGGGGRNRPAPADQAKTYQTALKLTDDQTAKITTILTATAAKRDSIQKAPGYDRTTSRPVITALTTASNAKIKALLTADQATEFDKMAAQRGGGRGGRGGAGGGAAGGTPPPPPPPTK